MESLLWNLFCEFNVVETSSLNLCCGICVVGSVVVESVLWNMCRNFVVESVLRNLYL